MLYEGVLCVLGNSHPTMSSRRKQEQVAEPTWDEVALQKVREMSLDERPIYVSSLTSSQRISVLKHMSPRERETCKPRGAEGSAASRASSVESKTPTWRTNLTLNAVKLRK